MATEAAAEAGAKHQQPTSSNLLPHFHAQVTTLVEFCSWLNKIRCILTVLPLCLLSVHICVCDYVHTRLCIDPVHIRTVCPRGCLCCAYASKLIPCAFFRAHSMKPGDNLSCDTLSDLKVHIEIVDTIQYLSSQIKTRGSN